MENQVTMDQLRQAFPEIDGIKLELVKRIINKDMDSNELESFEANEKWIKQCFNRPSDNELAMNALNELLEGHGVEPIRLEGAYVNRYYDNIIASYVNMGDTYITTIVFDHVSQSYLITSWGDFYESAEINEDYFS